MNYRILLIEDDQEYADFLGRGLSYEGYDVCHCYSAEAGMKELNRYDPDAILLDVMLPGMDGLTACATMREEGYLGPILMLTARFGVAERVTGLDAGADDYLGKPFAFEELLARLRAKLRSTRTKSPVQRFADIELDTGQRCARRHGKTIILSRTEYDLLMLLFAYRNQALTRTFILQQVWGMDFTGNENTLDVHISRLRTKIGDPTLIHTIYGIGYILKEEHD